MVASATAIAKATSKVGECSAIILKLSAATSAA
jgi:hypothetical protein